jgi:hypothetical protein
MLWKCLGLLEYFIYVFGAGTPAYRTGALVIYFPITQIKNELFKLLLSASH